MSIPRSIYRKHGLETFVRSRFYSVVIVLHVDNTIVNFDYDFLGDLHPFHAAGLIPVLCNAS